MRLTSLKILTTFLICGLIFGMMLTGCDQNELARPHSTEGTSSSATQSASKDIKEQRLKDTGLPPDLKQGVYPDEELSVPGQMKKRVSQCAPNSYDFPKNEPEVTVDEEQFGESALPPKDLSEPAVPVDQIPCPADAEKSFPSAKSEMTLGISKNSSDPINLLFASYAYIYEFFNVYALMGSYSSASENITYIDVIASSYVDGSYYTGYDYGYEDSFAGVGGTFIISNPDGFIYLLQQGNHYAYEEDCGNEGCSIQDFTYAYRFEFNF